MVYRLHPVFSSDFRTDFRISPLSQYWRHLSLATWGSIRDNFFLIRRYFSFIAVHSDHLLSVSEPFQNRFRADISSDFRNHLVSRAAFLKIEICVEKIISVCCIDPGVFETWPSKCSSLVGEMSMGSASFGGMSVCMYPIDRGSGRPSRYAWPRHPPRALCDQAHSATRMASKMQDSP